MSVFARLWIMVALAVGTAASADAAEQVLEPGTYGQINPGTKKIIDPGNQIVFVRGKAGKLSFSLNAIRALDQNSGYVAGTLPTGGRRATWTQNGDGINCKLTFSAEPPGLRVIQDVAFGDCGFGYGVIADGSYVRTAADGKLSGPPGP